MLVLGGGDGLAARELLRQPGIDKIVQVELDPAVVDLARTTMRGANGGSLENPRVNVIDRRCDDLAARPARGRCRSTR